MADAHSTPDTTVFKISQAERFTRVGYRPIKGNHDTPAINIAGQWLKDAGFTTGQALKLRIMPGCIVITTQDIHELWGNLHALSIAPFDEYAVTSWLNHFPGGLNMESAR
ncbi:SymE family type I addiction module toxin [Dickeya solani]|uniref:SymE family type I addiction module toxin n=2 Tax=Pectobacteriaceae TaxID=1903410 RepID=A0AAX4EU21_9GAMM|nr:SymE family type I addiction module toxin [Dickeya solani]WOA50886.1 SymE family type I addiction module toxin [Dickeya solani]WOA50895.1 SymE family type I addiction module toxin [Dickeya solani]